MRTPDVSRRHTDGSFRRDFADSRYKGNLAQNPAWNNAGSARRVRTNEDTLKNILRFDRANEAQSQPVVAGATDLGVAMGFVDDPNHVFLRHRNRTAGDVTNNIRLDLIDDLPARHLTHSRTGDTAGMNLHFDAPCMRPADVTFSLAVRQEAVIVENKFHELDTEGCNLVKVPFSEPWNQQKRAGVNLNPGWPQVVIAAFGDNRHRQRGSSIRRQWQPRQMQLAGGDQRRYAAMHIVRDPRKRVLRRRVFADGWMRMGIDQSWNRRDAIGVNDTIGFSVETVADFFDDCALNKNRVGGAQRTFQLPRNQSADFFDQDRRHGRTIAKGL